jgi:hypothetical protein
MRYRTMLLLLLPPLLSGCDPYYAYGPGAYPQPVYPYASPPPYPGAPPPYYGGAPPGYVAPGGYSSANCGTPDQPRPCYR